MRCSLITPHHITHHRPSTTPDQHIPKLILLRAGSLIAVTAAKFGTYHDLFSQFFQDGLNYNNNNHNTSYRLPQLQLISYNVVGSGSTGGDDPVEYPSDELLKDSIGLLITGSASNAYDDIPWINDLVRFSQRLIHQFIHLKLFGICFGHQILARALDAPVIRSPLGWEFGIYEVTLSPLGQTLFFDHSSSTNILKLHQVHRDIVAELPASTHSLGSTAKCSVHGFVKLDSDIEPASSTMTAEDLISHIRLITLQGHPEYNIPIVRDSLDGRTRNGSDWSLVEHLSYEFALDSFRKSPNPSDQDGSLVCFKFLHILKILS